MTSSLAGFKHDLVGQRSVHRGGLIFWFLARPMETSLRMGPSFYGKGGGFKSVLRTR
jgi:hypothetical protein